MNNTNLTTFTFKTPDHGADPCGGSWFIKHPIRVVTINNEPWFVTADVCEILGLVNVTRAIQNLDSEEVTKLNQVQFGLGHGGRDMPVISESGLYKLIVRSDKPQAKPFLDWVTKDVLPAIRKDGAYVMGEEKMKTGEMSEDEFVLRAIDILKAKVERYREENARLSEENTAVRTVIGTQGFCGV